MDSLQIELPLKDIHLPPPIGWWPPAPGWWLIPLLAAGVGYVLYRVWRRSKRPDIRKLGLRELARVESDSGLDSAQKVQQVSILLRRVALSAYPREQVAGLSGRDWLRWLDGPLADAPFSNGPGQALADAPFRAEPLQPAQLDALFSICRDWLQRVPSRP